MKLSVNEFETAIRKAAAGAGLGWGLGDALAAACREVAAAGGDGAAEALWALAEGATLARAAPSAFDRVAAGDAEARIAHHGRMTLLAGYAAAAARDYGVGFDIRPDGDMALIASGAPQPAAPPPVRVVAAPGIWADIAALGALTLVPSTARSRAEGAGAGLVDRD